MVSTHNINNGKCENIYLHTIRHLITLTHVFSIWKEVKGKIVRPPYIIIRLYVTCMHVGTKKKLCFTIIIYGGLLFLVHAEKLYS